jgi:ABC-2 type transport system ATP-binding protein
VLYGDLNSIRRQFMGHAVLVRAAGEVPPVPGVERMEMHNSASRLTLASGVSAQEVLRALVAQEVAIEQFEIATPTLDEIFIRVVQPEGWEG